MEQTRKTLSLRRKSQDQSIADSAVNVVTNAIQNQLCVRASYNRGIITLAPHILYTRHQDPFVDGVVIERNGAKPTETKLGTFKLAGLSHCAATAESFVPFSEFDANDPRYGEGIIARLQI